MQKQKLLISFYIFIVLFVINCPNFAADSIDVIAPKIQGMILCPQVYINDELMTNKNKTTSITPTTTCLSVAASPAVYYFTTTVLFAPVGVTMTTADSTVTCPSEFPVFVNLTQHFAQGVGQVVSSLQGLCCQVGVTVRVVQNSTTWVSGTQCP